jgi:microtubule-associated protein-like 1/2
LSIWDWRQSVKLAAAKCYNDFVFGVDFHPKEKNLIISCGKQHIFFWTIDEESKLLVKKSGVFETPFKLDKPKFILCFAFTHNGDLITGDSDGNLLLWNCKQLKISRVIKEAHEGGVFSILTIQNENLAINVAMVTGGGKDGRLVEWSMELEKTGRSMQIPEAYGTCRFVTNGQGNLLVIGTTKNCILLGNFDIGLNCIVNGHTEELWGLTVHPNEPFFLTCGNDRNIFYWVII